MQMREGYQVAGQSDIKTMKTGYVTYFMGANDLEGVKTRRMLNASISMDFQHTLRSYVTREKIDMRRLVLVTEDPRFNCFEIALSVTFPAGSVRRVVTMNRTELESMPRHLAYSLTNQKINQVVESARLPVKSLLMREYNRQTLHCYMRNRERYLTHE